MEKIFYPQSIAIIGLSSKDNNIPKLILENLLRWEYRGRLFGVHPSSGEENVKGVKIYGHISDLPIVPDLVVALIPARYVPRTIEECGEFGVKRMAIPSGGFSELGEEGKELARNARNIAGRYGIRFVGPNGVTVANTENGLCLPFVPSFPPPKGGLSIVTQSGGVGLMLWNLLTNDNVGMAKFASIGNKLDLDEVDFLEYLGRDPKTKIICMYLESINRGEALIEAASKIDKPILVFKSNTTDIGKKAAMSHTAALSNDEDVINSAFERVGITRIYNFHDFTSFAKAFELPPMRGNRIMVMSPAGGFTVMMGDLCEEMGFEFADPGQEFYDELQSFSNAGIINFSNPLDMGDLYDVDMYAHITYSLLHNDNVDGVIYTSQWPHMPKGINVFYSMFQTDLSKETIGSMLSSDKPFGVCLYGLSATMAKMKINSGFPLFDSFEAMIRAFRAQSNFWCKKHEVPEDLSLPDNFDREGARRWISEHRGDRGEETLEVMELIGVTPAASVVIKEENGLKDAAGKTGYPLVMKVVSPDALHKSDAGGVKVGISNEEEAKEAFREIRENLENYKKGARFEGIRVMEMAGDGYDMFIGGTRDPSFGPVVFFGYGGIYIEVFKDVKNVLCPAGKNEIRKKIEKLKSFEILKGARGKAPADIDAFVLMIERVSHLMVSCPEIKELDLNPVRLLEDGSGAVALDARAKIE